MTERSRITSVHSEKAVLVGVLLTPPVDPENPLAEMRGLAESAGAVVTAELTQRRESPDQTTYLGKGKVVELAALVAHHDADAVIFDNDLSPAQTRNLENALKTKVLDRSEVILDIFAVRARTYEARLAVELAQLEYSFPRLKQLWTHLSRLKMGIGMRGPGEKQLEVDRRLVEKRIHDLRQELITIHGRKERQVAARQDHMTVSLVGYTNAGKSTLLNTLTGSDELAANKLFATLDTRTRRWRLDGWGPVLISDTVGFIRDLPHRLIASFRATLEETRAADLLLHVADASSPQVDSQITAVRDVLTELEVDAKDTLLVLNKVDAISDRSQLDSLLARYPHAIAISARSGAGIPELIRATSDCMGRNFRDVDVRTTAGNGRLMAWLAAHGEVLSRHFDENTVTVHCRIPTAMLGRIDPAEAEIHSHSPATAPSVAVPLPADDILADGGRSPS
ncbi:MAG: GTPase HflX [Planctomycetota bacterium]|nr:MAG: GTPase HflX [Planctomycetota bacterium]